MTEFIRYEPTDAQSALPDTLRDNLARAIDLGTGLALVRLPDHVPLAAVEELVRRKGGVIDHFRRLPEAEVVGGKFWEYGLIEAIARADDFHRAGESSKKISERLARLFSSEIVRIAMGLIRREKPCTAILISPEPGTSARQLDGTFFQLLHFGRDQIFPILRDNETSLFVVGEGENGFRALQAAMASVKDLNSIRDLPIEVD